MERFLAPLKAINSQRVFLPYFEDSVAVTDKDRALMLEFFGNRPVHTVETGVNLDAFPCLYQGGTGHSLIFLGHYRHFPNEDAAMFLVNEILPLVQNVHPDVTLTLVGSNPTRKINKLRERRDIFVTGTVASVSQAIAHGSVFVAPVRLGGGIKGKIIEAMAVGLPVVATSVAASGLGAEPGKDILVADDAAGIAGHILALLEDQALRMRLSRNARLLVEARFSWKELAQKMAREYSRLLEE